MRKDIRGKKNPMFGKHHTEETKKKMKEKHWMKGKHGINVGEKNPFYGHHHTEAIKQRIRMKNRGTKIAEKNPMWKGDAVGFIALHEWVKNRKPKPELCEMCNERPPMDLANISGKYKRDVNDFKWMCRKCHMLSDGRMMNLKQNQGR